MLLNEREILIFKLISIIYNLYKTSINNKKLLKESLSNILRSIKKLFKELINLVIVLELLT